MITTTSIPHENREQWLGTRHGTIGGSDAPAVLGVCPFVSPYQLWALKTGRIDPEPENSRMRRGKIMEEPVARMIEVETGWTLTNLGEFTVQRHPEREWQTCTLDRIIAPIDDRGPGNCQIKTVHAYGADAWEVEPPLNVLVQVQHEMAVTGLLWTVVAAWIGGDDLRLYQVERNERFIASMNAKEEAFWRCVQEDIAPPVDGSAATAKVLSRQFPQDSGSVVDLPADAGQWDEQLLALKAQLKEIEERKTELENRIKAAIGEASEGLLPTGGRYRWKTTTRKYDAREAYETTFRELRRLKK